MSYNNERNKQYIPRGPPETRTDGRYSRDYTATGYCGGNAKCRQSDSGTGWKSNSVPWVCRSKNASGWTVNVWIGTTTTMGTRLVTGRLVRGIAVVITANRRYNNFTDRIYRSRRPSARYVFRFQQHDEIVNRNQITVVSRNSSTRFIYSNRTIISTTSGTSSRHRADGIAGVCMNTRTRSIYNITRRETVDKAAARYFEVFVTTPAVSP